MNNFEIAPLRIHIIAQRMETDVHQRIHKGYIVSLEQAIMINKEKTRLCLRGNKWLPIGRSYLPDLMEKLVFFR